MSYAHKTSAKNPTTFVVVKKRNVKQDSPGLFLAHKECVGLLSLFLKSIQVVAVHRVSVSSAFSTEKAFKSE